jgi:hypothetical protein
VIVLVRRQLLPPRPTLAEYDALAQPWIHEQIARYHWQNREVAIPRPPSGLGLRPFAVRLEQKVNSRSEVSI